VNHLNATAAHRERPLLDVIGRELTQEALERLNRQPPASSFAHLREVPDGEYAIPRSHHVSAFGAQRRNPTIPRPKPKK
jgi:hypothetical protein